MLVITLNQQKAVSILSAAYIFFLCSVVLIFMIFGRWDYLQHRHPEGNHSLQGFPASLLYHNSSLYEIYQNVEEMDYLHIKSWNKSNPCLNLLPFNTLNTSGCFDNRYPDLPVGVLKNLKLSTLDSLSSTLSIYFESPTLTLDGLTLSWVYVVIMTFTLLLQIISSGVLVSLKSNNVSRDQKVFLNIGGALIRRSFTSLPRALLITSFNASYTIETLILLTCFLFICEFIKGLGFLLAEVHIQSIKRIHHTVTKVEVEEPSTNHHPETNNSTMKELEDGFLNHIVLSCFLDIFSIGIITWILSAGLNSDPHLLDILLENCWKLVAKDIFTRLNVFYLWLDAAMGISLCYYYYCIWKERFNANINLIDENFYYWGLIIEAVISTFVFLAITFTVLLQAFQYPLNGCIAM